MESSSNQTDPLETANQDQQQPIQDSDQEQITTDQQQENDYPKQWDELSPLEKQDFILSLSKLYLTNNLRTAKIQIQQQIAINLLRGGKNSVEEFLFSENIFSQQYQESVERFSHQKKSLQEKFDESTCLVVAESGFMSGDQFPEIRGLLHISKEIEQKILSTAEDKQNLILLLWSTKSPNLEDYLTKLNAYVLEIHAQNPKVKCIAVNTDRVFLYNDEIKQILIDKINLNFLRDTDFSQINNLFSTRYVKNVESANSYTPFLIVTDNSGKIVFSKPAKKIEKFESKLKDLYINGNPDSFIVKSKKPFVEMNQQDYHEYLNEYLEVFSTFFTRHEEEHPNLRNALKTFPWKVNLKAKAQELQFVRGLLETDIAPLKREGFYVKINQTEIPVTNITLAQTCQKCQLDLKDEQQYIIMQQDESQKKMQAVANYCFNCSQKSDEVILFGSNERAVDGLIQVVIRKRDLTKKSSTSSAQCDACKQFFVDNRYKCCVCNDFDLCERCFDLIEIEGDTKYDDGINQCTAHERGKHPFWIVKNYKDYEIL
eukprot:403342324